MQSFKCKTKPEDLFLSEENLFISKDLFVVNKFLTVYEMHI